MPITKQYRATLTARLRAGQDPSISIVAGVIDAIVGRLHPLVCETTSTSEQVRDAVGYEVETAFQVVYEATGTNEAVRTAEAARGAVAALSAYCHVADVDVPAEVEA